MQVISGSDWGVKTPPKVGHFGPNHDCGRFSLGTGPHGISHWKRVIPTTIRPAGKTGRWEGCIASPCVAWSPYWRRLHPVAYAVGLVGTRLFLESRHRAAGLQAVLNPKHGPCVSWSYRGEGVVVQWD